MKRRFIMVGCGGFARGNWINRVFPDFADRIEAAALVDVAPDVLKDAGGVLNVPEKRQFTDIRTAFEQTEADFCCIVVPPAYHKDAVLCAVKKGIPILSEKPIADTLEAGHEIYRKVTASGVKMAVIQNYRYTPRILAFKKALDGGSLGRINYIIGRFAANYLKYGAWGKAFRHEIPNSLLIEGSVHHFDMLRNLAGADCKTITGYNWNPAWSSFKGNSTAVYVMEMANGVRCFYEGNCSEAGVQNSWHKEYYRAECEKGAVELGGDDVVRVFRPGQKPEEAPLEPAPPTGHHAILDRFLGWLDGGDPPETQLEDNIKSFAMLFAAIEAAESKEVKNVADYMP
ncbi:MAG: Gfo/Idh/MocA family oxidoreductase [Planctomycetota bacterium]